MNEATRLLKDVMSVIMDHFQPQEIIWMTSSTLETHSLSGNEPYLDF
jgi:hypothetical protein